MIIALKGYHFYRYYHLVRPRTRSINKKDSRLPTQPAIIFHSYKIDPPPCHQTVPNRTVPTVTQSSQTEPSPMSPKVAKQNRPQWHRPQWYRPPPTPPPLPQILNHPHPAPCPSLLRQFIN